MKHVHRLAFCALLGASLASCETAPVLSGGDIYEDVPPEMPTSYVGKTKNLPIYQILVYSFADGNGDGIGDFQGIIDRLDYLKSLNVGYLWLSPIHPSPTYHHYDVKDYYAIDETYGGLDGFKALIAAAKEKGIGIVMDMVFNHASKESQWFQDACNSYSNHVKDGTLEAMKADPNDVGNDFVLSNVREEVSGQRHSINWNNVGLYYEGNFSSQMPEFNLKSPSVKKKQAAILKHYLDLGVAGFRFDGCRYFMLSNAQDSVAYLDELAAEARKLKSDVLLVGEWWDGFSQSTLDQVTSTMPLFNFPTCSGAGMRAGMVNYAYQRREPYSFASRVYENQKTTLNKSGGLNHPVYFLNNHDMNRYAPKDSEDLVKLTAASYLLTPGTPTIYYGEEILLKGTRGGEGTDAARRLPMQWIGDASKDTLRPTKIYDGVKEPKDQVTVGALEEIEREGSITNYYKKVLQFRADHPEIGYGIHLTYGRDSEKLSMNRIVVDGNTKGYLVHNMSNEPQMTAIMPEGLELDTSISLGKDYYQGCRLQLSPYSTVYLEVKD